MSLRQCPLGARIESRLLSPNRLVVQTELGPTAYPIACVPAWVREPYARVLPLVGLRCAPQLFALEHAGGAIGFSFRGVIAVGLTDFRNLVETAYTTGLLIRLDPRAAFHLRRLDARGLWTDDQVRRGLMTCLVGHELHHAWLRQEGEQPGGIHEELACDRSAGHSDEVLGVPVELGVLLMRLIGCTGDGCAHPTPADRVRSYLLGRAEAARRVASAPRVNQPWLACPESAWSFGT